MIEYDHPGNESKRVGGSDEWQGINSNFNNRDLSILTTDGVESFLTASGIPDQRSGSDHLPILFRLDFSTGTPNVAGHNQPLAG